MRRQRDDSALWLHALDKCRPDIANVRGELNELVARGFGQVYGRLHEVEFQQLCHLLLLLGPGRSDLGPGHGRLQLVAQPRHGVELVHVLVHH